MVFDRYEIHVQAFLYFINGKSIICQASSPQNIFKEIYTQHIFQIHNFKKKTKMLFKKMGIPFKNFEHFQIFRFSDMNYNSFNDDSIFSCIFLSILVIVRRYPCPDFDKIVAVPEIIQKIWEKVRGP